MQDQEIIKAYQVEEDQTVVRKVENLLDQRQNAKRTYLSSEKIYHLFEGDAEEWSADGSESSNDDKEDHVSNNALSVHLKRKRSTFHPLDRQILSFRKMEVKFGLVIL